MLDLTARTKEEKEKSKSKTPTKWITTLIALSESSKKCLYILHRVAKYLHEQWWRKLAQLAPKEAKIGIERLNEELILYQRGRVISSTRHFWNSRHFIDILNFKVKVDHISYQMENYETLSLDCLLFQWSCIVEMYYERIGEISFVFCRWKVSDSYLYIISLEYLACTYIEFIKSSRPLTHQADLIFIRDNT